MTTSAGHADADADADATPLPMSGCVPLECAVGHPLEWVQAAIGTGIGAARLHATAVEAEMEGRPVLAAQVWALLALVVDEKSEVPPGGCRREAWRILRKLGTAGGQTVQTIELEATVIRGLVLKKGGLKVNTAEYHEANRRLDELLATDAGGAARICPACAPRHAAPSFLRTSTRRVRRTAATASSSSTTPSCQWSE